MELKAGVSLIFFVSIYLSYCEFSWSIMYSKFKVEYLVLGCNVLAKIHDKHALFWWTERVKSWRSEILLVVFRKFQVFLTWKSTNSIRICKQFTLYSCASVYTMKHSLKFCWQKRLLWSSIRNNFHGQNEPHNCYSLLAQVSCFRWPLL